MPLSKDKNVTSITNKFVTDKILIIWANLIRFSIFTFTEPNSNEHEKFVKDFKGTIIYFPPKVVLNQSGHLLTNRINPRKLEQEITQSKGELANSLQTHL